MSALDNLALHQVLDLPSAEHAHMAEHAGRQCVQTNRHSIAAAIDLNQNAGQAIEVASGVPDDDAGFIHARHHTDSVRTPGDTADSRGKSCRHFLVTKNLLRFFVRADRT